MKPINIYFAAAWTGGGKGEINLFEATIRNKLVSFVYPSQLSGWFSCLQANPLEAGNIIIDSGAFSAWNKGSSIDINAYIEYAKTALETVKQFKNQKMFIVNLDVIPGSVGKTASLNKVRKTENLDIIDQAAKQGYKNMKTMLKAGITPIHVFHQGEHFKWLDRMIEQVPYIGVSPANDLPSASRNSWMHLVFEYLDKKGAKVDTHGFAVTSHKILRDLPWTSCDAASWRLAAGMGNIYLPKGGFSNPDYSKGPDVLNISEKTGANGLGDLTPGKVAWVMEETGYSFEELQTWQKRTLINIRFFLGLEKWLNEYKKNHEYRPRAGFGF